jgi:Zn finger protein HypA/HybF involved in hydrogenase expression
MTHEFESVQSLICDLLEQARRQRIHHVAEVRVRRSSAFSEEGLKTAFYSLIPCTPLQDARLVIETANLNHKCHCGREQVITSSDLYGSMFVCPDCGTILEVGETQRLEIVKITPAPQAHVSV